MAKAGKQAKIGERAKAGAQSKSGKIRVGVGGWTFEPWRGSFYPEDLPQKRELEFASRALTSLEINGTYYSTFKPDSWRKWHNETPDDFVFAVKASRYATNRKVLAEAGSSVERFLAQGMTELGPKLGPISWQLAPTKKFDALEIAGFLSLLPKQIDGVALRHVIEVRHPTFACVAFTDLARQHRVAVAYAEGENYPQIDADTADFRYARLMISSEAHEHGVSVAELKRVATLSRGWAKTGDVFLYFISAAKERNPAAAKALIEVLGTEEK